VNNAGQWGRWAIIEVDDPWKVKAKILEIRAHSPAPHTGDNMA
jgi:hypothetical protein